ncbi:S-adenosyl-L-methionine-dependent methyltransferase [Macrophomina phaseolina]|uniref:S-adenosyl-L-methionine-dependent methyltransferase n=1 Tax=Macrophomina phaseolina TaxID=35725 RepID=A0ABQ8G525_9PEZI|nr:S-adenosyl-L-methionine-dependent methyltransferase [Macrophomina phaseolina]
MGSKSAPAPPPRGSSSSSPKQPPKSTTSTTTARPKPLAYTPHARAPRLLAAQAALSASQPPAPLHRSRRIALLGASLVGAGLAFYVASATYSILHPYEPSHPVPADVSDRYDAYAARFDADVGGTEKAVGIERLRRKLVAQARGDVLEVSAGTGRNTAYYDWGRVRRVVLLDQSAAMLEVAREKWEELRREREEKAKRMVGVKERVGEVEFRAQSALEPIEGPGGAAEGKFDTVVQTMGLCSTHQPERLLQRMGEVLKRDGKILLLEHGRASYGWLNNILDRAAPGHADKHGCWWNKDIGDIVEKSGLEVVQISRPWYHFGTTWWVELRKSEKAEAEAAQRKSTEGGAAQRSGEDDTTLAKSSWLGGWRSSS